MLPKHFKVLLLEDDETLSSILGIHLNTVGYDITRAGSLQAAKEALQQFTPDVAILDVHLPDGSGLDLIEELRRREMTAEIPVIVVTGSQGPPQDTDSNIVKWLTKPFDCQHLLAAVEQALGMPGACKVLVIDDDTNTRTIIRTQLQSMGLRCIEATDGIEAINLARSQTPDLIILDVVMPHIDGFKVVEVLSQEQTQAPPLIVYSGKDLTAQERNQLTLGITKFITKGCATQTDLTSAVLELIGPPGDKSPVPLHQLPGQHFTKFSS